MDHTDIVCSSDVECDRHKPDYEFRIYLARFINWFVNGTFHDLHIDLDPRRIKSFKIQVFKLYSENETNGVFLQLINNFNIYMTNNATTTSRDTSIPNTSIYNNMNLYPDPSDLLDRPTADFYNINGQPINTKIINLVIAAHIIHKILSELVALIRVSELQTYMELLPSDDEEELHLGYLETLHDNPNDDTLALLRSTTPLQAEIILHAENFQYYKSSRSRHTISEALSRYPGLSIEDVRLPVSILPPNGGPNGGAKKRNKSKRRNQKKSNKKSRRHRNRKRKRLSRRNAKRFY